MPASPADPQPILPPADRSTDAPSAAAAAEKSDALDLAELALKSGHFAAARRLLAQPAAAQDPARRATLLWRLTPDPLVLLLVLGCAIFFAYIAATTQH